MKITVNVECSPQEARAFLGLPDLEPVNAMLVAETQRRLEANLDLIDPQTMLKSWTALGGAMADQMLALMSAATGAAAPNPNPDPPRAKPSKG